MIADSSAWPPCTSLLRGGKCDEIHTRHQKPGIFTAWCWWRALGGAAAHLQARRQVWWWIEMVNWNLKGANMTRPKCIWYTVCYSIIFYAVRSTMLGGYVFMLFNCDGPTLANCSITCRCLMIAGPGTGKTWSSCQLMYHLSKASIVLFLFFFWAMAFWLVDLLTCWLVWKRLLPHSAQLQDLSMNHNFTTARHALKIRTQLELWRCQLWSLHRN